MGKVYETLKKKNDTSVEVYPNIERQNVPDGAINTAKLEDGAVTENKIGTGVVSTDKITIGAVTTDKLRNSAVTTAKINDGAVTTAKINDGAVTEDKIGTDAVTTAKIKNNSIIGNKIYPSTIIPSHLAFNLYAYVGSDLEFTDNGDNIMIYIPQILTTENILDTSILRNDIDEFVKIWCQNYFDSYIITRGKINGTWYDAIIHIDNPDVSEITIDINNTSYTITSSNYELFDMQKLPLLVLR